MNLKDVAPACSQYVSLWQFRSQACRVIAMLSVRTSAMTSVKGHFHFMCDKIVKSATHALYVLVGPILFAAATSQGTTVNHTNYTFHNSLQLCMYFHEMQ